MLRIFNRNIGKRLTIGFSVVNGTFVFVLALIFLSTSSVDYAVRHVADSSVPTMQLAEKLVVSTENVAMYSLEAALTHDRNHFKKAEAAAQDFKATAAKIVDIVRRDNNTTLVKEVESIAADLDTYSMSARNMAETYITSGKQAGDEKVAVFDKQKSELVAKIEAFYEMIVNDAQRDMGLVVAEIKTVRIEIIVGLLVGTLLGLVAAFLITRSITRPLTNMQDTIVRVEQSSDLTLRTSIVSQDEVGRTAVAFDKMMAKIATLVGDTRQSSEAIAAAAQSMATAGTQVEKSSNAQSEAASAVAAAVEQTSVSISETASNARIADETATRARAGIETTLAAVRETAANVDTLAGMIGEASCDIAHLAESSRQIDGIVQTIKDIADQTNLLALNAAIEAARAGEQGRGFAVVADEVRKLAENTTKATSEISGLISNVQSEVDGAVARMQQANDKAGTTRDRVIASTGALDAASANTGQVTESVRSIAAAVREQDVAVQEVAKRMEQIAQMTEENTAAAANAADTARQLDGLAGKLREAVGRFRV